MLNALRKWREKRRAQRRLVEKRRGFDYAAGRLLEGTDPEVLTADLECYHGFGHAAFDAGAAEALVAWDTWVR